MSELAAVYYKERAERLQIEQVPDILKGKPKQLLGDGQHLSLQRPDPGRLAEVTRAYADILHTLDPFVLSGHQVAHPADKHRTSARQLDSNNRHIRSFVTAGLFPNVHQTKREGTSLMAGRITDIEVEAIAYSEIRWPDIGRPRRSMLSYQYDKAHEDAEVYLLASGTLFAGRPLGYTACLTVVMAGPTSDYNDSISPKYRIMPLRRNDQLGQAGLSNAQAVSSCMAEWNITHPQLSSGPEY